MKYLAAAKRLSQATHLFKAIALIFQRALVDTFGNTLLQRVGFIVKKFSLQYILPRFSALASAPVQRWLQVECSQCASDAKMFGKQFARSSEQKIASVATSLFSFHLKIN